MWKTNAKEYVTEVKDGCLIIMSRYPAELKGSLGIEVIPPALNSDM